MKLLCRDNNRLAIVLDTGEIVPLDEKGNGTLPDGSAIWTAVTWSKDEPEAPADD
jgi:hypothetical protein